MSEELGRKYPCFGEFKCPRCRKKWQSSKTWADFGQQCKFCSNVVNPSNLQRLFVYICSHCDTKWKWSYVAQGLQCIRCSSSTLVCPLDQEKYIDRQFIRAHKLKELDNTDEKNYINPNKEHRQDLCEKCIRLGRPCRETAGQELRSEYPPVHYRDTSLSTSSRPPRTNKSPLRLDPSNSKNASPSTSYRTTTISPTNDSNENADVGVALALVAGLIGAALWYLSKR